MGNIVALSARDGQSAPVPPGVPLSAGPGPCRGAMLTGVAMLCMTIGLYVLGSAGRAAGHAAGHD
jgi:hypothetical protein